jgi:hypothetical protein
MQGVERNMSKLQLCGREGDYEGETDEYIAGTENDRGEDKKEPMTLLIR